MTKREVGFLACRLMAVYLFMQGIWQLSNSLSRLDFFSYSANSGKISITVNGGAADPLQIVLLVLFQLSPVILTWAGVIGLWVFSGEVAKRLFDGAPEAIEEGQPLIIARDIRAVAFCCLGLFFLVNDFSYIAALVARPVINLFSSSAPQFNSYMIPPWEIVVRFAISLWLVFGARGLAGLWRLAQRNGRSIE